MEAKATVMTPNEIYNIMNRNSYHPYYVQGALVAEAQAEVSFKAFGQWLEEQGANHRVKCPHCSWSQFTDEVVGMSPCIECNSTGYTFKPLRLETE